MLRRITYRAFSLELLLEHGHSHGHSHGPVALPENAKIGDVVPHTGRQRADSMSSLYQHPAQTRAQVIETAQEFGYGRSADEGGFRGAMSPPSGHSRTNSNTRRSNKRGGSLSRPRPGRLGSGNNIPPLPGSNEVRSPHPQSVSSSLTPSVPSPASPSTAVADSPPVSKILEEDQSHAEYTHQQLAKNSNDAEQGKVHNHSSDDEEHEHDHSSGGHGHDHGSMNMRGVFLHVLGDA